MNQVWTYQCAASVQRTGIMLGFRDYGGTDVSYKFHRLGDDGLPITFPNGGIMTDIVSGQRLKDTARRIGAVKPNEAWKAG